VTYKIQACFISSTVYYTVMLLANL